MKAIRYSSLIAALAAPFVLLLLIGSVRTTPPDPGKLVRIKILEDDRYVEGWEIARYVHDSDPQIRSAAVTALGRIGRVASKPTLLGALEDPDQEVRALAAFALGQLGDTTLATDLRPALEDPIHQVRKNVIEALGKVGDPLATLWLVEVLRSQVPDLRGEAALALARLKDPRSAGPLVKVVEEDAEADVRWRAAYALSRLDSPGTVPALERALEDPDPLVAMFAAKGLGTAGAAVGWNALVPALRHADWRVQVNGLLSLGELRQEDALATIVGMLSSPVHHVRVAACAALGDLKDPRAAEPLRERLQDPSPDVRSAAAQALARVEGPSALADLVAQTKDPERHVRGRAYEAMGQVQSIESLGHLRAGLEDPDAVIRTASMSAVALLHQRGVTEALMEGLEDPDWVVAAVAAEALGTRKAKSAVDALKNTFQTYAGEGGEEVRLAVVTSLRKIGALGTRSVFEAALHDPDVRVRREAHAALREIFLEDVDLAPAVFGDGTRDGSDLAVALGDRQVRIETSRGTILCVLYGDDAPQTVASFLKLAREGFYDGLTFHRVVPNFVIQGGCPRGDGWGGPGYTIRCEINERRYLTGTMGMALSGKDTGGSQFFITHSPQPRLDGGYTVFGQVLEGQDVVDAIVPGDRIVAIREI